MYFRHPGQAQVEYIRDTEIETTSQVIEHLESASRISRTGLARSKYLAVNFLFPYPAWSTARLYNFAMNVQTDPIPTEEITS